MRSREQCNIDILTFNVLYFLWLRSFNAPFKPNVFDFTTVKTHSNIRTPLLILSLKYKVNEFKSVILLYVVLIQCLDENFYLENRFKGSLKSSFVFY